MLIMSELRQSEIISSRGNNEKSALLMSSSLSLLAMLSSHSSGTLQSFDNVQYFIFTSVVWFPQKKSWREISSREFLSSPSSHLNFFPPPHVLHVSNLLILSSFSSAVTFNINSRKIFFLHTHELLLLRRIQTQWKSKLFHIKHSHSYTPNYP